MSDVTQILSRIDSGEQRAAHELLPLVYDELRRLAAAAMAKERPGQTLSQRWTNAIPWPAPRYWTRPAATKSRCGNGHSGPIGLPSGPLGGPNYYSRGGLGGARFAAPTVAGGAALLYDAAYATFGANENSRD